MFFKPSPLKYWFILIFAKPGEGKSLEQARLSEQVMREYFFIEKKYTLPQRLLLTNQYLNFNEFRLVNTGIGRFRLIRPFPENFVKDHVFYWEKPDEFRYCPRKNCWKSNEKHDLHDVDLFIDEMATLFPADKWSDTPFWLRKLWMQHRHNGIRCVGLTQNYAQVDVNCRRVFQKSYLMKKFHLISSRDISATLPPIKRVYGIYSKQEIDPLVMEKDQVGVMILLKNENAKQTQDLKELNLIGYKKFHLITRHKILLYDTQQNVKEYPPQRIFEHSEAVCENPNCGEHKVFHRLK